MLFHVAIEQSMSIHWTAQALLSVRLNVTRNLTQDIAAPLLTTTLNSPNDKNLNRLAAPHVH